MALLVEHTTLLEISCRGTYNFDAVKIVQAFYHYVNMKFIALV